MLRKSIILSVVFIVLGIVSPAWVKAADLTIDTSTVIAPIPEDFLGVSGGKPYLCREIVQIKNNTAYRNMFLNLSPGVLRFGGSNQVNVLWRPNGICTDTKDSLGDWYIGANAVDVALNVLNSINWRIIWSINIADPTADPVGEAKYVYEHLGQRLYNLAPNNEGGFSVLQPRWPTPINAIRAVYPNIPISGPGFSAIGKGFAADANAFLDAFHKDINQATYHYYTSKSACPDAPSATELLDSGFIESMFSERIDPFIVRAKSYGLPVRMDEGSTYPCAGVAGLSDRYVSALWGVDYMFTALSHGVSGVNMQGGAESVYGPIHSTYGNFTNAASYPNPLYYAMLLFKYATSNGHLVKSSLTAGPNNQLRAWAVITNDNKLQVILLNKNAVDSNVTIHLPLAYQSVSVARMVAPSLTTGINAGGSTDIKFAGNSVNANGTWSPAPKPATGVTLSGNTATLTISPYVASVFTFENPGNPPTQPPAPIPGDINGDGHVTLTDFDLIKSGFGNLYTIFDFNNLVTNFGK